MVVRLWQYFVLVHFPGISHCYLLLVIFYPLIAIAWPRVRCLIRLLISLGFSPSSLVKTVRGILFFLLRSFVFYLDLEISKLCVFNWTFIFE
jgi:hypothetical protein